MVEWMREHGLKLALEKTEAVILTQRKKHNKMVIKCDGLEFPSKDSVRYLGIQIDTKMHYNEHAKRVAKSA